MQRTPGAFAANQTNENISPVLRGREHEVLQSCISILMATRWISRIRRDVNFWWTEEEAVCTISCSGGEKNWWLVNREGTPTLSLRGDTKWLVSDRYEGRISISVFATDGCLVLSHADGQLALQSDYRGEGELWKLAA